MRGGIVSHDAGDKAATATKAANYEHRNPVMLCCKESYTLKIEQNHTICFLDASRSLAPLATLSPVPATPTTLVSRTAHPRSG